MITFLKDNKLTDSYNNISVEELYHKIYGRLPCVSYFKQVENTYVSQLIKETEVLFYSIGASYYDDNEFLGDILSNSLSNRDYAIQWRVKKDEFDNIILFKLNSDEDGTSVTVAGLKGTIDTISKIISEKYLIRPERKNKVGVLYNSGHGLSIKNLTLPKFDINIEMNYGAEFTKVNETILQKLREKKSGLVILSSLPGAGKSFYIKHLCSQVDRQFIFVPINMIDSLTSPDLLPILIDQKDTVLILEDAEKAVISREESEASSSLVSTILNLSDGILGSLLNTSVIVTFNTSVNKIDKALKRKGRLLAEHRFEKLPIKNAQDLINHLGKKYEVKEPMTLAEIYGVESENFAKEDFQDKRLVGFGRE